MSCKVMQAKGVNLHRNIATHLWFRYNSIMVGRGHVRSSEGLSKPQEHPLHVTALAQLLEVGWLENLHRAGGVPMDTQAAALLEGPQNLQDDSEDAVGVGLLSCAERPSQEQYTEGLQVGPEEVLAS